MRRIGIYEGVKKEHAREVEGRRKKISIMMDGYRCIG